MTPEYLAWVLPAVLPPLSLGLYAHWGAMRAGVASAVGLMLCVIGLLALRADYGTILQMLGAAVFCALGLSMFILGFERLSGHRMNRWQGQLAQVHARRMDEEKKRDELKKELEKSEREVVRTLRLYGAMKGLGEGLTWDEMVPHIDYAVKQCLGLQDYQLYLQDENNRFQKVISRGFHRFHEPPLQNPSAQPTVHQTPNETYIEIPVRHGELEIGLLWARVAASNQITKEELLVEALDLSEGLGMGLQKARLFTSLEKLSRTDGLTGLHRRQIFNERLSEELRRARAFRTTFSLLLADLDHFKQINDTYGHQAGDEVLKRVSKIIKDSIYETDFVARYGGEEFVVLLAQTDPEGVQRKAEIIRQKVASETFVLGWHKIQVSISIGVAHYPRDGGDTTSLINGADQALYAAKTWGRNRVVDCSQLS